MMMIWVGMAVDCLLLHVARDNLATPTYDHSYVDSIASCSPIDWSIASLVDIQLVRSLTSYTYTEISISKADEQVLFG